MPALKDIKRRIKSVKSTQKITQAMYMIATTKLKRAENRVKASRPFSKEVLRLFQSLLKQHVNTSMMVVNAESALDNYPVLMETREVKNIAILVVGSNKGLAGPYITNITRAALERIFEAKQKGIGVKLLIVGQRTYNSLKRNPNAEIVKLYSKLGENITPGETSVIAEDLASLYVNKQVDKIEIITTEFLSKMTNRPKIWQLLPLELPEEEEYHGLHPEMLFEPSVEEVLQRLLPMYLSNRIYQAIMESYASELSSRMTAMKSATDNAEDMIQSLTLTYNKARQTTITQEILEVVSGANALE